LRRAAAAVILAILIAVPFVPMATAGPRAALPSATIGAQLAALPRGITVPGMTPEVLALADHPARWQDLLQFNEVNLVGHALPAAKVPAPVLPSAGIAAVLAATGTPNHLSPLVLAKYDAMPRDARDALGSLLMAYVEDVHSTTLAFKGLTVAQREAFLDDPRAPMPDAWDWATMLAGQRELVAAAQAALPVLKLELPVLATLPPVSVCSADGQESVLGGINLDFTATDDVYTCDIGFSIDLQGDDVYLNNGGGSGGTINLPVDTGVEQIQHFSLTGVGFALDVGGDNQFIAQRAQGGIAGGAFVGQGTLIVDAGSNLFHPAVNSSGDFQGGAEEGAGLLLNVGSGNDVYSGELGLHRKFHSSGGGLNGGAVAGAGFMADFGGDDVYDGFIDGTGGVNGGLHGGSAALLDFGGNDVYNGEVLDFAGVNGGGIGGHGLLLDAAGDDVYRGTLDTSFGGVNGGAWLGTGQLVDLAGDDDYDGYVAGSGGVNGGSFDPYSYGLLWDGAGSDHYDGQVGEGLGESGGVNGAAMFGQAQLLDLGGGDDRYETHNQGGAIEFANGAAFLSEGLLFDDGGLDGYRDHAWDVWHWDQSCYPKGSAAGVQMDFPHASNADDPCA
jgi:hypothetical protein